MTIRNTFSAAGANDVNTLRRAINAALDSIVRQANLADGGGGGSPLAFQRATYDPTSNVMTLTRTNGQTVELTLNIQSISIGNVAAIINESGQTFQDTDSLIPTSAAVIDYVATQLIPKDTEFPSSPSTGDLFILTQRSTTANRLLDGTAGCFGSSGATTLDDTNADFGAFRLASTANIFGRNPAQLTPAVSAGTTLWAYQAATDTLHQFAVKSIHEASGFYIRIYFPQFPATIYNDVNSRFEIYTHKPVTPGLYYRDGTSGATNGAPAGWTKLS